MSKELAIEQETRTSSDMVIRTRGLTKKFGRQIAVNGIDFEVRRGEVFGFLGPNGAGKTTTVRMLLGLLRPNAGQIELFGLDAQRHRATVLPRIGAIIETPAFYAYLTGTENLHTLILSSGWTPDKEMKQRIQDVLALVGLQKYPRLIFRKYSLGMKQRLAIAAALLTDPELVMLDEPTNGLDPEGIIEVRELITDLAQTGKTIFLSSHLLAEVQQICSRVAIMRQGQIVMQGDVHELLHTGEQIEVRLVQPEQTQAAYALLQQAQSQGYDWLQNVVVQEDKRQRPYLLVETTVDHAADINVLLMEQRLAVAELHPRERSLEELFLQTTAQ